jgi:tRNA threonylcarbamoyladenosine biosynthesis protein TsaE
LRRKAQTAPSNSAAETEEIGARIASELSPGDVVLVSGELGAGKTTLIRGACRALGVEGPVRSPTFTIGSRYRGHVPITHLDLYRIEDLASEVPGLLDDYLAPDAITFVEWPDAAEGELEVALRVGIAHRGGDARLIEVRCP